MTRLASFKSERINRNLSLDAKSGVSPRQDKARMSYSHSRWIMIVASLKDT
jgi:hypothetical protein